MQAWESQIAGFARLPTSASQRQNTTTPEEVVSEALKALQGETSTVVPGALTNQIIVNLPRFFPRDALVKVVEQQFRPNR